jgi:predicted ATP-dependent protease
MERLTGELRRALQAAFESEDFRHRKDAVEAEAKRPQEEALARLTESADDRGLALVRTPVGMMLAPVKDGRPMPPEDFRALPAAERQALETAMAELQGELEHVLHQAPQWQREAHRRVEALVRETTRQAVGPLIDEMRRDFADLPAVQAHLDAVADDVTESVAAFLTVAGEPTNAVQAAGAALVRGAPPGGEEMPALNRYKVNLLVDNAGLNGAPVIVEDHPTYDNLVGRVEHVARMGTLVTDFTLIRAGALHRANGGFLVIDARRLLGEPYAWDALKRLLRAREIRIEPLGERLSLVSTVGLEPEPIALDVRVVLIGDPLLYALLYELDPDFADLFKVPVDFGPDMDRTEEATGAFARLIATQARSDGLRPLDAAAVARVIDHAARRAEDAEKLSLHRRDLADLLREADWWAGEASADTIDADHVRHAIDAAIHRADRRRERAQEAIRRDILRIETAGAAVGQVNGLSVARLGGFSFGRPTRISARVRLGGGKVVDIEREVELGGPLHSKGVLILQGFLGARYARDKPLALAASLVFEQSYGGVDGDSASAAELYALLSALAEVPIAQGRAVTGSVDQHGRIQAIGAVNEKIEGFFDVCAARGLTGDQGVLIPEANRPHLMLRDDVVAAAAAGRFHVWPVTTVDQGMTLLTGLDAGTRRRDGRFPARSLNGRVDARLSDLADAARHFARPLADPAKR